MRGPGHAVTAALVVREAQTGDGPGLADLLARAPQAGRVTLAQDRRPDVFARRSPYPAATTLVVGHAEALEAAVTVAAKPVVVGGEPETAAYVFDLAVSPAARGRGLARSLLGHAADWAHGQGAGLSYAHVLAGNAASAGVFRSAGYSPAGTVVVRAFPAFRRRAGPPPTARSAAGWGPSDWEEAATTLARAAAGHDLARPLDGPGLRGLWTALPGWSPDTVWLWDGTVLGLWDHREVMRSVPTRLPVELRALRPVTALARRAGLPSPRLPRMGEPLGYGLVLGGAGEPSLLRRLAVAALGAAHERGLDLVLGPHDRRARLPWRRAGLAVATRYTVMARSLRPGPGLGARPLCVDPVDL